MSKKTVLALASLGAILLTVPAFAADPGMPGVEKRRQIQQERIGQGVSSGQLTPRETMNLERQQAGIERAERRAGADGKITPGERARLHRRQDRASRNIFRKKHNARTAQ